MALQATYWDLKLFFLFGDIHHCGIVASLGLHKSTFLLFENLIQCSGNLTGVQPYDAPDSVATVLGIVYRNLPLLPKSLILEWWGTQSELGMR